MYDNIINFLNEHWFSLIQTVGILFSILWSAHINNLSKQTMKVSNYLLLTQCHRDVWKVIIDHPEYYDNLFIKQKEKITIQEKQFLSLLFLHITCTFELIKNKQITDIEAIRLDIGEVMTSKSINIFWANNKKYYNSDFIDFIQDCKLSYGENKASSDSQEPQQKDK